MGITTPAVMQFEIVRHVTLPQIKLPDDGSALYLRFEKAIETARQLEAMKTRRSKNATTESTETPLPPPQVAEVTNLQTGELGQFIVNAVLESNLNESYPDEGYVKKCFSIKQLSLKKGRGGYSYKTFEILEIRLKEAANAAPNKTATRH
jgi:hypothetical protein